MKNLIVLLSMCMGYMNIMAQCIGEVMVKPNAEFRSIAKSGELLLKEYKGTEPEPDYYREFPIGFLYRYGNIKFENFRIGVEELELLGMASDMFSICYPLPFEYDFNHYMDQVDEVEVYFQNEMEGADSVAVIEIRNLNFEDNTGAGRVHVQYRISQKGHIDYIVENSITTYDVLIDWWYLKENEFITSLTLDWSEQSSDLETVCFQDEISAQDHGYMIKDFPLGLSHFVFGKNLSTTISEFDKTQYTISVNGSKVSVDLMGYQPSDARVITYDGRLVKSFKDAKIFESGISFENIPKGSYIMLLDDSFVGKFIILN